ncbi:unnamed protein product [Lactuca virosa]|uniref:Uncharacterized protein n=1 Tax=Lactuca virosa TaxID=75947 RepID=A0AAU9MXD2_9ASTR|nr:unnamed protein product [Lactuca virosa]
MSNDKNLRVKTGRRRFPSDISHADLNPEIQSQSTPPQTSTFPTKMSSGCALLCEIIFALLLPPLGVCLRYGCCTAEFFSIQIVTITATATIHLLNNDSWGYLQKPI